MNPSLRLLERSRHMCDSVMTEKPVKTEQIERRRSYSIEELLELNRCEPAKWSLRAIMSEMTP